MHPQLIAMATDSITLRTHTSDSRCATGCTLSPITQLLLSPLVSSKPTLCPMGLTKQKQIKKENWVNSLHPLCNREGTTELPSATNLGQTKAKSARISHYTCFPSSLSPERTREKGEGFWGFHLLRQWSFKPHKDHILLLTPTAAVKDVRGEMRLGGGLGEEPVIGDQRTSGNNEEFSLLLAAMSPAQWDWNAMKCDWNPILQSGITGRANYTGSNVHTPK